MQSNTSDKLPYIVGIAAVGGAVGFLFLTRSGKRIRESVMRIEATSAIPDKIDDVRHFIERKGNQVGGRVKSVVNRVKGSVEAGRHAYEETESTYQQRVQRLDRRNTDVIGNIHRAIDNLNRTIHTFQETVLDPLYEMGAIARGVERGLWHLSGKKRGRNSPSIFGERLSG